MTDADRAITVGAVDQGDLIAKQLQTLEGNLARGLNLEPAAATRRFLEVAVVG